MGNYVGKKYNKLLIVEVFSKRESAGAIRSYAKCKCDCGREKDIRLSDVITDRTKTCGCYRVDRSKDEYLPEKIDLYRKYKRRAKSKKIPFSLSKNYFFDLLEAECFYCGEKATNCKILRNTKIGYAYYYNGVDRLDSDKGYTIENTVPSCGDCNLKKRTDSPQQFYAWINRTYNHLKKKNLING